ncbi:MAG: aldehyde dehydrogenase family protein [Deltaproteobacteria bacterium]|nr:aldehyde dehydrogenase family protein [Deltaproteobacteria bacterium]
MKILCRNPATLESLGEVPVTTPEEVRGTVAKAREAFAFWSKLSFKERGKQLLAARDYIGTHRDEIAAVITKENGKPLAESISADIVPVMDLATYFARNAEKILRREKVWLGKWNFMGRQSFIEFAPLGVVGIIAPWNFPFSIPCGQTIMALAAGNTVVLKPAGITSLIGLKIQEIFDAVGLPKGVLTVVTGDSQTGAALVQAGVQKIIFTGSVGVGRKVMEMASKTLTPVVLELGGKDPMVVLPDADLETASSAAVWGAFTNCGQVCASVERLYLHESIAESFIQKCVQKTRQLRIGEGIDPNTDVGPLTNESQLKNVEQQVESAKREGAKVLVGGNRVTGRNGYFYTPTILTNVHHRMEVMQEETFGPVLPIMTFKTEEEAIRLANDSRFGLTASVWTKNIRKGTEIAQKIEAGTVTVNENVYTYAVPQTPWGGPKESGIGRTHGRQGFLELVEPRHIHINRIAGMKDLWWYSYNESRIKVLKALADLFFVPGLIRRAGALVRLIGAMFRIKNV